MHLSNDEQGSKLDVDKKVKKSLTRSSIQKLTGFSRLAINKSQAQLFVELSGPALFLFFSCFYTEFALAMEYARPVSLTPTKLNHDRKIDDQAILNIVKLHKIPGAAMSLIRQGKLVAVRGYGVIRTDSPNINDRPINRAVDGDTLFRVGSISKSFTGLAAALLIVDGKLSLQTSVSKIVPEFAQPASSDPEKIVLSDLLTHSTGLDLAALDVLIWPQPNQFAATDVISAAARLRQAALDRSPFSYSNAAYVIAGEIISRVSGMPYHRFVEDNIFKPLGMNDCVFGGYDTFMMAKNTNIATPHIDFRGDVIAIRPDAGVVPVGVDAAAGGARCSARSMMKWLQFMADPSSAKSPRLTAALRLATTPRVFTSPDRRESYGLGFEIAADGDDGGENIAISHSGGVAGMLSFFAVWPSTKDGLFMAINKSSAAGRIAIKEVLVKALTKPLFPLAPASSAAFAIATLPATNSANAEVNRIAGKYRADWLGDVNVCNEAGKVEDSGRLVMRIAKSPGMTGDIRLDDISGTPAVFWRDPAVDSDSTVKIVEVIEGRVTAFQLLPITTSDFDFSYSTFKRKSDCDL